MLDEKFAMIFFFFYEMLDEIGAFKRIQYFVQHCKFRMLDERLDPLKSAFIQQTTKNSKHIKTKAIDSRITFAAFGAIDDDRDRSIAIEVQD